MILLRMTLVCCFIDQRHDRVDRIHLVAAAHGFYVFLAVEVKLVYFIHQQIRRNIILVQKGFSLYEKNQNYLHHRSGQ